MIILCVEDGFGNQLFEYAYARMLQEYYREPLVISTGQFILRDHKYPELKYILQNLNILENISYLNDFKSGVAWTFASAYRKILLFFHRKLLGKDYGTVSDCFSRRGIYSDIAGAWIYRPLVETNRKWKFLIGRWQSEKYFASIAQKIKREARVSTGLKPETEEWVCQIENQNSVCVHIRLGDYWNDTGLKLCTSAYYLKAMRYIQERVQNPVFYVFTNSSKDFEWIRNNIHFDEDMKICLMDLSNPVLDDYYLMYHCKHFVLSNSSLSWWAQYVSTGRDKIVVAPRHWNTLQLFDRDIYMDEWVLME